MKKYLRIAIIVIVTAALGAGIYFAWRSFVSPKRGIPAAPGSEGGGAAQLNLPKALSDDKIFDYWPNKKTGEIYYITEDGLINKISPSGEGQETGSRATGNLSYIKPSSDGTKVLAAFGYPQSPTFAIHNLAAKTWQALPAGTTAAAWDPLSSDRLAYLSAGERSTLYLLTLNNQKSQTVTRLAQQDFDLEWVLPDVIYLKEKPSSKFAGSLWAYSLKNRTIRTVVSEEAGLMVKWSNDGRVGLKFSNGTLAAIDSNNRILSAVPELVTLPSKCTLNLKAITMYCAAYNSFLLANIAKPNLPDDYLKKEILFQDDIYEMSLLDLDKAPLTLNIKILDALITGSKIDADHLELNGSQLLFINRYDQKLYSLSL